MTYDCEDRHRESNKSYKDEDVSVVDEHGQESSFFDLSSCNYIIMTYIYRLRTLPRQVQSCCTFENVYKICEFYFNKNLKHYTILRTSVEEEDSHISIRSSSFSSTGSSDASRECFPLTVRLLYSPSSSLLSLNTEQDSEVRRFGKSRTLLIIL